MHWPSTNRPHPVWWELVEESLEEADFLWRRRERAIVAADHSLADVARFAEERLLGCVDGLRVGGDAAIDRVLAPALESDRAARVSVAAYALAGASEACWERLAAALPTAGDRLPAMARGIELVWPADVLPRLQQCTRGAPHDVTAAVVEILAFRRRDAGPGARELLAAGDARLQRAVLSAARFAPAAAADPLVRAGLALPPSPARDAAVETGVVLGLPSARAACADGVREPGGDCRSLLVLGALAGTGGREPLDVVSALGSEALAPAAVWALGFAGTREAADACLELVQQQRHAALASEAFCAITGVAPDEAGLRAAELEPDSLVPARAGDDALDAELGPAGVAALPLADGAALASWWSRQRTRFTPGIRYVQGRPVDQASLLSALATAPMRRRRMLALELAILTQGRQQLETRASCREQRAQLEALSAPAAAAVPRVRASRG